MGINENNLVVGYYYPGASLSPGAFACTVDGGFIDLTAPRTGYARAVNFAGQVVGTYSPTQFTSRAFLWEGGKIKDLTYLQSTAYGINRAGQVVGNAKEYDQFAFLWDPNFGLMNLNGLIIPPQPDWVLVNARGINANMQIIGMGTYQGVTHAFLLDRVGTTVAEIVGLLLLQSPGPEEK